MISQEKIEQRRELSKNSDQDTIAAIATAPGHGGVGVIRISGKNALSITQKLTSKASITPRFAHFCRVKDINSNVLDEGVVIFFPGPKSFTGEDVVELQLHGSPVVLSRVLDEIYLNGARGAEPGEFSKRAYLNDKIDLVQAEAISDLIMSQSKVAADAAMRSLQGAFSDKVNLLLSKLIEVRVYSEASLDFADEDIEHESLEYLNVAIAKILLIIDDLISGAQQGRQLGQGVATIIIGPPNAGKSSLFNVLVGDDAAIVSSEQGTTRDLLRERVVVSGVPLILVDTAGIRDTNNIVESIGIKKATQEVNRAELAIIVVPAASLDVDVSAILSNVELPESVVIVANKCDLHEAAQPERADFNGIPVVYTSALNGDGISMLSEKIRQMFIRNNTSVDDSFSARARHVDALKVARSHIFLAQGAIKEPELCAEELKLAQNSLAKITGDFCADDLLGEIFSTFCIGK